MAGLVVALLGSVTTVPGQALAADSAGQPPHIIVLEKDGPVPVPVGQIGSIATMHLPRGRWAILAKLNPVNTGVDNESFVRCRLEAGGDSDRTEHTIFDPSVTQSRIVLGLQIAHFFSRPEGGSARLGCSSTQEDIEARFIRVTAVKAGRLTRIALGSRTRTTNGVGIPKVVFAQRNGPVPVRRGEFGTVARIHLAHGSWVVFAKLDVARTSGTASALTCRLSAGADFDRIDLAIGNFPPPPDRPIPLLNVAHTFDSAIGGPVELRCRRSGAPLEASFVRLTAIRAGHLNDAPIRSAEGGDSPRIVFGHRDGPVPIESSDEYRAVARLRLPRGSWLVLAKANVGRDRGTGEDFVDCRLVAGDDRDQVNLYTNDREGVAFHLPHRFTSDAGGAVVMRCRSLQSDARNDVRFVRFTAIRAGTLAVRRV
jgi:hypothetical protein